MKKVFSLFLSAVIAASLTLTGYAAEFTDRLDCKSAILVEASIGRTLYEKNADQPLPPASVTKIMTVLLVC